MNVKYQGNTKRGKDEWLTPPEIIKNLGVFDTDPCSPINRPWNTAKIHFDKTTDGIKQKWIGRVFLNPPYDKKNLELFLNKAIIHKNCIVLIFARTETNLFFKYIWEKAKAVLFIKGRLKFYHVNGIKGNSAGSGSVLVAYDNKNAKILKNCRINGKYIKLR